MPIRKPVPMVVDPLEEGPPQPHPNVPPKGCTPDRRLTARHVERILRESFAFPVGLDHKVTEASEMIAVEILKATHDITALYWNPPNGSA